VENGGETANKSMDPAMVEGMAQAVEGMSRLGKRILEENVADEHVWFRNLLIGLINCALQDYRSVQIGCSKSTYLAAWGTRNLLELKVTSAYIVASGSNAAEFKNDLLIDTKEFYEAVTKATEATHEKLASALREMAEQSEGLHKEVMTAAAQSHTARRPKTEISDAEVETYRQLMAEYGIDKKTKPKRASEIARLIKEARDFDPMFKLCSKIMHRTALSIASTIMPGSLDEAVPFLTSRAASDFLSIYDVIERHVNQIGIRPSDG